MRPFAEKIWLSSPTMHGEELDYMKLAYETNWMSTVGENIDRVEELTAQKVGMAHAVALSCGTMAIHMAVRLAGERLYGPAGQKGALAGHKVFCSDVTFCATVNPVVYEGGEPVFIDTERDTWNMDPEALERAFRLYPEVKLVVLANLYGTPGKMARLRDIAHAHGALLIEDAAESLGATYQGVQTGTFGDYSIISFNGNKIITGSAGGVLLTNSREEADKARKLATQARENIGWYQHDSIGYNYRMSNVIAGVVRGQFPHLEEHIAQKTAIYKRYQEGLKGLPADMNPFAEGDVPNFWLSCLLIRPEGMCEQVRGELETSYRPEPGKSCPDHILAELARYNAEGRPVWKPMHAQPVFRGNPFVAREDGLDVGSDLFRRGLCLPSDNKMTPKQQEQIIRIIRRCFGQE